MPHPIQAGKLSYSLETLFNVFLGEGSGQIGDNDGHNCRKRQGNHDRVNDGPGTAERQGIGSEEHLAEHQGFGFLVMDEEDPEKTGQESD